jgi:hypothetical protein
MGTVDTGPGGSLVGIPGTAGYWAVSLVSTHFMPGDPQSWQAHVPRHGPGLSGVRGLHGPPRDHVSHNKHHPFSVQGQPTLTSRLWSVLLARVQCCHCLQSPTPSCHCLQLMPAHGSVLPPEPEWAQACFCPWLPKSHNPHSTVQWPLPARGFILCLHSDSCLSHLSQAGNVLSIGVQECLLPVWSQPAGMQAALTPTRHCQVCSGHHTLPWATTGLWFCCWNNSVKG